jgi:hypothetical protein
LGLPRKAVRLANPIPFTPITPHTSFSLAPSTSGDMIENGDEIPIVAVAAADCFKNFRRFVCISVWLFVFIRFL